MKTQTGSRLNWGIAARVKTQREDSVRISLYVLLGGCIAACGAEPPGVQTADSPFANRSHSALDSSQYNFESGVQGWTYTPGGEVTGLSSSTAQAYTGAGDHSLAVSISATGSASQGPWVDSPSTPAGVTVTFHVWVPSGSPLVALKPYIQDANWSWDGNWVGTFNVNAWNTVTVDVPSTAALPLHTLGIELEVNGTWSGTVYLDAVSWPGGTCTTCAAEGKNCGTISDGCGGTLDCGTCTVSGETCGGGGVANVCGGNTCTTCAAQGAECGSISDGCGGTLNCGSCPSGQSCSNNVCVCNPTTCAAAGAQCGSISDGCSGTLNCGSCPSGQSCSANACTGGGSGSAQYTFDSSTQGWTYSNGSVTTSSAQTYEGAQSLAVSIAASGSQSNGPSVSSPSIPAGVTVTFHVWIPSGSTVTAIKPWVREANDGNWDGNWVGTFNTNAWTTVTLDVPTNAVTPLDFLGVEFEVSGAWSGTVYMDSISWPGGGSCTTCAAAGAQCGSISDGCGGTLNCGSCSSGQSCSANVCVGGSCTTCAAAGAECGSISDGCGGTLNCGSCTISGETCGGGGVANVCGTPPPPPSGTFRVMAAGDSITLGDWRGGYRYKLYNDLITAGYGIDMVGGQHDGSVADNDHEGYSGLTIGGMSGLIDNELLNHPADYVLLMIGTNDLAWWTADNGTTTAGRANDLITQIQNDAPNAWIIVTSIPPEAPRTPDTDCPNGGVPPNCGSAWSRAVLVADYNSALQGYVQARINAGEKIAWADVYHAITVSDTYDGIHPTEAGYDMVADEWYPVLTSLIGGGSPPPPPPPPPSGGDFVTVQNGTFMLGSSNFYFAGTNAYYLMQEATYGSGGIAQTIGALDAAQATGMSVIRTWGFADGDAWTTPSDPAILQESPGVFDEGAFQAMDYVISEAGNRNLHLIIALVNNWPEYGGIDQYLAWAGASSHNEFYTNNSVKQLFKNYVSAFLNRVNTITGVAYKDDPTIMAWEIMNEGRAYGGPPVSVIANWYEEMATYIKSIDPNHLVTTGEEGFDNTTSGYSSYSSGAQGSTLQDPAGTSYTTNIALPDIDFGTAHMYPGYWSFLDSDSLIWISDHNNLAANQGKPFVLGEFGSPDEASRAAHYQSWVDEIYYDGTDGSLLWELIPDARWDPQGHEITDIHYPTETSLVSIFSNHAAQMNAK